MYCVLPSCFHVAVSVGKPSRKSRSLSVSSVSSVSSASSSSSSVRSADSDDMYADLASPVSSASSRSPTTNHPRKERVPVRDRPPQGRDKIRERPSKKEEPFREDRRKMDPSSATLRGGHPGPRSGPGSRGGHHVTSPTWLHGPPGSYGGSGSHKDIKLTLLNKQQGDKGSRKRYLPADKERPGSPPSKRVAMSPDRGRDKRIPGRPPLSPGWIGPEAKDPDPCPPRETENVLCPRRPSLLERAQRCLQGSQRPPAPPRLPPRAPVNPATHCPVERSC
ncbi:zinc finger CCCH domain-containing protein 18-like [Pseudochaenichthys georgianus]|uniref:zinc finger CCCH domain-containing protein 18-like n=1 Tax=Pseudochaenichthys georgianus TaxID=52239 RepID=UPI0039C3EBB0